MDDAHVVHAAILGRADAIVTADTRSGIENSASLAAASIETLPPYRFAANTVIAHPEAGRRSIVQLVNRRQNPPTDAIELLEALRTQWHVEEVYDLLHGHFTHS